MSLQASDVLVALKVLARGPCLWTYASLGKELSISPSQVFRSVARAEAAHFLIPSDFVFLTPTSNSSNPEIAAPYLPQKANLKEFLVHGAKYVFPVHRGGLVRGMPTAHAAPPLAQHFGEFFDPPPVWPDPQGSVRGVEFSALYKNVPAAARRDAKLYELLALVDAIRDGRAREREIAVRELTGRIDAL